MIEWSWRIEGPRSILCGSWGEERRWAWGFRLLLGPTIEKASLTGHLPELTSVLF